MVRGVFRLVLCLVVAGSCAASCEEQPAERDRAQTKRSEPPDEARDRPRRVDSRPPPMHQPVDLWDEGKVVRKVDAANADQEGYVLLELGEDWTPYIFTDRDSPTAEAIPNEYRETYLALARGEFPKDHHGERAKRDRYLELYGILPTLAILRKRMHAVSKLKCAEDLDLAPLEAFDGFVAYRNNQRARRDAKKFNSNEQEIPRILRKADVDDVEALDLNKLPNRDRRTVREYTAQRSAVEAIRATQDRLKCEGFFADKGRWMRGALDWVTHEALAEFERRHRVYGWGFIGRDTVVALRRTPLENEREAVVRVLTERAMHAAGVIEDGSTSVRKDEVQTFTGADGEPHPIPNLEESIRNEVVKAFGLQTPESTLAWLDSLGDLTPGEPRLVAVRRPEFPEYYDQDMDLFVEVDRGDVWYEFLLDETGAERSQPVGRRPRLTIYTKYLDQKVPLARLGTTIGGWRSEYVEGTVMWKYKNSPTGMRVWHQIVASPVWMPPDGTPPRSLLKRVPGKTGKDAYKINYHETGPSYASAYGLVAAYHLKYYTNADGELKFGGDEGIRTHGSVDYMSIMRRHSHGCHRLHNHIAVRLMSFVLAHRPHKRVGQQEIAYRRTLEHEDEEYFMKLDKGGYVFQLEEPVYVRVREGRVRGTLRDPIPHPIPRYDHDIGAYMLPDGGAVAVSQTGDMVSIPVPDAGPPDGGYPDAGPEIPVEELPLPLPAFVPAN